MWFAKKFEQRETAAPNLGEKINSYQREVLLAYQQTIRIRSHVGDSALYRIPSRHAKNEIVCVT